MSKQNDDFIDDIVANGSISEEITSIPPEPSGFSVDEIVSSGELVEQIETPEDLKDPFITQELSASKDIDQALRISKGNLAWALNITQDIDAPKAREIESMFKSINAPRDTIERNMDWAKKVARNKEVLQLLTSKDKDNNPKYPGTLRFFESMDNTKLYKDEAERLAEIEGLIKSGEDKTQGFFKKFGLNTGSGILDTVAGLVDTPKLFVAQTRDMQREYDKNIDEMLKRAGVTEGQDPLKKALKSVFNDNDAGRVLNSKFKEVQSFLVDDIINGRLSGIADDIRDKASRIRPIDAEKSIVDEIEKGNYADAFQTSVLQVAGSLPSLALMAVTGTTGLGILASSTAANEYSQMIKEGKDPEAALMASSIKGGAEALFEVPTLSILTSFKKIVSGEVKKKGAKVVAQEILKNTLTEGSSEAATSVVQDLADFLVDETHTISDMTKHALDSFIVGGMVGGGMSGAGISIQNIRDTNYVNFLKEKTKNTAEDYTKLSENVSHLKEKGLSDEDLEKYLTEVLPKDSKIFVESSDISTYFQDDIEGKKEFEEKMGIADQMKDAESAGTVVEINKAKWLSNYANTEIDLGLKNKLKDSLDSLSVEQSQKSKEEIVEIIRQNEVSTQAQKEAEIKNIDAISKDVEEKLINNFGEDPKVARSQAALYGPLFNTLSTRNNIPINDLYERYGLTINEGQTGENIYFQDGKNQDELGFYSALENEVSNMDFKSIPAKDLLNRINKIPGIKPEEIEFTGLKELLESTDGKVSKEDIIKVIQGGGLQLNEIVKGGEAPKIYDVTVTGNEEEGFYVNSVTEDGDIEGELAGPFSEERDAEDVAVDIRENAEEGDDETKYSKWSLDDGKNYREVLLQLPSDQKYQSSHWKDVENVLAHFRLQDFQTTDGKKTLLIEEIQSDWHQDGRKRGYSTNEAEITALPEGFKINEYTSPVTFGDGKAKTYFNVKSPEGRQLITGANTRAEAEASALRKINREANEGKIPNAPLKQTDAWASLVFKRVLRMAVEQGYDSVSWVPGDVQAARYDLSKSISRVTFERGTVQAYNKEGVRVVSQSGVLPSELPNYIGKDASEKLLKSPVEEDGQISYYEISNEDLKVGGEGMTGFYDNILPKAVNKLLKKLDKSAKVGTNKVEVTDHIGKYTYVGPTHSIESLNKIKKTANVTYSKQLNEVINALEEGMEFGEAVSNRASPGAAELLGGELKIEKENRQGVWNVELTDKLKQSVMEGQTLFQKDKKGPRGQISFGKDRKFNIELFERADKSTFLHESGHFMLEIMRDLQSIENAPEQTKEDWRLISEYLEIGADGVTTVEQHEKFARSFEAYLMTGKAPSKELTNIFETFAKWLTQLYKTLVSLDVKLTDEVKGVFDRMLATDQQIAEVQNYYQARGEISDLIPNADTTKLKEKKERAKTSALQKLRSKYMSAYLKAIGGRKELTARATKEVEAQKVYEILDNNSFDARSLLDFVSQNALKKILSKHGKSFDGKVVPGTPIKTWGALVLDIGGINPESLSKDQRKMLKENGAANVLRKSGRNLDQVAQELNADNRLFAPESQNIDDYLFELLLNKTELDEPISRDERLSIPKESKGLSIIEIAAEYDFNSPTELIALLEESDSKADAIKKVTDEKLQNAEDNILQEIADREGLDPNGDYHDDAQVDYLIAEAQLIENQLNNEQRKRIAKIDRKALKDEAIRIIGAKNVQKAGRYDLYSKSEQKYANEAYDLFKAGKIEDALEAKKKQIINHALVIEAVNARKNRDKILSKYKVTPLKKRLEKTEYSFRQKALDILSRFQLANLAPDKDFNGTRVADLDSALAGVVPEFVDIGRPENGWKDLTYQDFLELNDGFNAIMSYGNVEFKALKVKGYADAEMVVQASVTINEDKNAKILPPKGTILNSISSGKSFIYGWLAKTEFIFNRIDRNVSLQTKRVDIGPLGSLFRGFLNTEVNAKIAWNKFLDTHKKTFMALGDITQRLDKENKVKSDGIQKIRNKISQGHFIEIEGVQPTERMRQLGMGWTSESILAFVLNMGNEQNLRALQNGYQYTPEQLNIVASYLTEAELKTVQATWDMIDTLYPEISKEYFNLYNSKMGKVEAQEITLISKEGKPVTLKGGYYPLSYDGRLNNYIGDKQAKEDFEKALIDGDKKTLFRKAKAEDGFTLDRVANSSLPPRLDLNVLFKHLQDTNKFIHQATALKEIGLVINNKSFRDMVEVKHGKEAYTEIHDWLLSQASKERSPDAGLDRLLSAARNKATAATLGLNFAVGIKQRLSMFGAMRELGAKYSMIGFKKAGLAGSLNPTALNKAWKMIEEKSKYMRVRGGAWDADLSRAQEKIRGTYKSFKIGPIEVSGKEFRDFVFFWIQMNDRAAVTPLWLGAYNKSLDASAAKGLSESEADAIAIDFADGLIRTSQPSSLDVDRSKLQRSRNHFVRLYSMFQTWRNLYGNRMMEVYGAYVDGDITLDEAMRFVATDIVAAGAGVAIINSLWVTGDMPEWGEYVQEIVSSPLSVVPIVDTIPGSIKFRKDIGQTPALLPLQRALKAGESVYKSTFDDKEWEKTAWDIALFGDILIGVPAAKLYRDASRTYKNVVDK